MALFVSFLLLDEAVAENYETKPVEGVFFGLSLGELASDIDLRNSMLMAQPMYFDGMIPLSERYRVHQKKGLHSIIQQNNSAANGFPRSEIDYLPNYGVIEKWVDSKPIAELTTLKGRYVRAISQETLEVGFAGPKFPGIRQKKGGARQRPSEFFVCGIWRERIFLAQDHTGKKVSSDFSLERSQFFADALRSLGFRGAKEPSTEVSSLEWIFVDDKSKVRIQAIGRVQHITISPARGSELDRKCRQIQGESILNS